MTPLDAIFHLLNFAAPALAMAVLASTAARVLWRHELRSARWIDLARVSALAGLVVQAAGLVVTGRDANMEVYAAMALACAASLWWMIRRR
jgi:hypothetical protein